MRTPTSLLHLPSTHVFCCHVFGFCSHPHSPFSILSLPIDAVQRMYKVMSEGETAKDRQGVQDVRTETNYAARKFYSQRNMYLTGFTLFLSL